MALNKKKNNKYTKTPFKLKIWIRLEIWHNYFKWKSDT